MSGSGSLQISDCGRYDFIHAIGELRPLDFIKLYCEAFARRQGAREVAFLIDIDAHPSVLGVEDFSQILSAADIYQIGHIEMMVFCKDSFREIIGKMVEELSRSFNVTIKIGFYDQLQYAENALKAFLEEGE